MKLMFLGATHEVTGSCTLVEIGGHYGLVDCGMEQGEDIFVNQAIPVNPGEIDFVLLTHAHIDHSGNIPLLFKNGFDGPVYATDATCHLCEIMLRDCAHIQESDAEWKSRKARRAGEPATEPVYTLDDAEAAIARLRPCAYGEEIHVAEGVVVRFTDAGHLLGSASIEVFLTEDGVTKKAVFSGDIGNHDQPIIRDPQYIEEADYVVTESTYGDRQHEKPAGGSVEYLASVIQRTLDRGGNVVIPSFAVGRTQELLYFIRQIKEQGLVTGHGDFPVYVDSPLANEATGIFLQCDQSCFDEETLALVKQGINPIWSDGVCLSVTSEESKQINFDNRPKVILSASGMCEAGRIRHHLKHNLWNAANTILFVGYQAENSLGRRLQNGAQAVRLFGEDISVNAEIASLHGTSGHADQAGLLNWLAGFESKLQKVFINHGDDRSCIAFQRLLTERGYDADAPYSGTAYDLQTGLMTVYTDSKPIQREQAHKGSARARAVYRDLLAAAESLLAFVNTCKGRSNKDNAKLASQIRNLIEKWR